MQAAITAKDAVITTYRDHGHMLACGMDPKGVMAELTGRRTGYSKGKGGSMHMFSREKNFFGGHGIVGAPVSIGTGIAFAQKYRDDKAVTLTYFGDGASNQGQVHEAFNMASLWKLPVIYVCENNLYNEYTSYLDVTAGSLTARAEAFGIEAHRVDGQDVLAVNRLATDLVARCRKGEGPFFVELRTYRYHGHHVGDINREYYRSKKEEQEWKTAHDPIRQLTDWLTSEGTGTDVLDRIHSEVKAEMEKAVAFAVAAPYPKSDEVDQDIYA